MEEENTQDTRIGKLYIVATPIGNLEDLTLRAIKTLEQVSIIACEDTRQTQKLLNKYKLRKKLISYFHPREKKKIPLILGFLKKGKDVALVSDAGTPGLSDPGFPLIRESISLGIKVVPIPGPSALTTALSAAGLPSHRFLFLGFAPQKKEATRKLLLSLRNEDSTLIFFLPPRRLTGFLRLIEETLGERQTVIAREMTKIYEEFLRGTCGELIKRLEGKTIRGEATILIGPKQKDKSSEKKKQ